MNEVGLCVSVNMIQDSIHARMAGVTCPSLISRLFSAVAVTCFCFEKRML